MEHYIRDQRIATIANTLPLNSRHDTTQPTPQYHPNPYQLNILHAIAEHDLVITNDPNTNHPPPLISDSDTEDEDDIDDTNSAPPLIRLDAQP